MDAREYWKQCIIDYIDCLGTQEEIDKFSKLIENEEMLDVVINDILNNDYMWSVIDETIYDSLAWANKENE